MNTSQCVLDICWSETLEVWHNGTPSALTSALVSLELLNWSVNHQKTILKCYARHDFLSVEQLTGLEIIMGSGMAKALD